MKKVGPEEKYGLASDNVSSSCHSRLRSEPAAFQQVDSFSLSRDAIWRCHHFVLKQARQPEALAAHQCFN